MYKSREAVRGGGGSWCFRILRASLRKRLEGFRIWGEKGYLGASRWHDTSTNGGRNTHRLRGIHPCRGLAAALA